MLTAFSMSIYSILLSPAAKTLPTIFLKLKKYIQIQKTTVLAIGAALEMEEVDREYFAPMTRKTIKSAANFLLEIFMRRL